jgi:cytochrome c2
MRSPSVKAAVSVFGALLLVVAVIAITAEDIEQRSQMRSHAAAITGGDPRRGEAMFISYGCGSCHALKDVRLATGAVGPPLDGIAVRAIIAGKLSNKSENLEHWIRDPQAVTPGTAMPDLNVGERDARDMTAFLYTRAQ